MMTNTRYRYGDYYSRREAQEAAKRLYHAAVDKGEGYAVGDEEDLINDLEGLEGLPTLVCRADTDNDVAIYEDANSTVAVGYHNGPFAVRLR